MKKWYVTFLAVILVSCTDYVSQIEDERDEWRNAQELAVLSSSSEIIKTSSSSFDVILSGNSYEKSSSGSVKSNDSSSSAVLSGDSREEPSSSSIKSLEPSSSTILSSESLEESSSSEEIASSSSSKKDEISSSSEKVVSSSSGKASWAYLNPAISYGEIIDARDGQVYKTVVIGEQTWMAENLNLEIGNSYCFNNEYSYCAKYGRLYTWATSMDSVGVYSNDGKGCGYSAECSPIYPVRGICPEGWHLPSKEEWEKIFDKLKEEREGDRAWLSTSELDCHCGFDKYGLSVLGSAGRDYAGNNFGGAARTAFFQTSTMTSNTGTHSYTLYINADILNPNVNASITDWSRLYAFSVRCLKNSRNILNSSSSASAEVSSSSTGIVSPCKTSAEDNCEYGELKDSRDGKTYKTVKIGNQWWLAENLNYGMTDSYCYLDSAKYCVEWGRLYTWTTALLACPIGTHLPAKTEFEILFETVGGQTMAGKMLKSIGGWNEQNGIDAYSFTVLPAGYKDYTGTYGVSYPGFWSSTEYGDSSAYHMHLYQTSDYANLSNPHKSSAYSVRCIID